MHSRSTWFLLASMLAPISGCGNGRAIRQMELHGAAVSKPLPDVSVFVPQTTDHRERNFGDSDLAAIAPFLDQLTGFNHLNLSGTNVSDAAMQSLRASRNLQSLDLSRTKVTANGLLKLSECPKLRWVGVSHEQLTDTDEEMLKKSMPNIKIVRARS